MSFLVQGVSQNKSIEVKNKKNTQSNTLTHERFALRSFPFDSHTAVTKVDVYFCLKTQLYVCESARVTSIVCNFLSLHHTHTHRSDVDAHC